jgi:hypothetical protein
VHLVYLDESGNSGLNLHDPEQPLFALCAMIVDEKDWQGLEQALKDSLNKRFPKWKEIESFEVHAVDLRRGKSYFEGVPVADRIAFRDEWMLIGKKFGIRLSYYTVSKKP